MNEEIRQPENQEERANVKVKPELNLNVDRVTAINLTILEYDKRIGEAEEVVAKLKGEKAAYIYDSNVDMLVARAKQQQKESS